MEGSTKYVKGSPFVNEKSYAMQWSAYRPCQGLGSHIDEKSTAWEITVGLYENLMSNNFRDGCSEKMWIET